MSAIVIGCSVASVSVETTTTVCEAVHLEWAQRVSLQQYSEVLEFPLEAGCGVERVEVRAIGIPIAQ